MKVITIVVLVLSLSESFAADRAGVELSYREPVTVAPVRARNALPENLIDLIRYPSALGEPIHGRLFAGRFETKTAAKGYLERLREKLRGAKRTYRF
jgi:hypothetical protein